MNKIKTCWQEASWKRRILTIVGIFFVLSIIASAFDSSEDAVDAELPPMEVEAGESIGDGAGPLPEPTLEEATDSSDLDNVQDLDGGETVSTEAPATTTEAPVGTFEQQQAIGRAESYLNFSAFSRAGLISQLEFEGFSNTDATFAVDNVSVDWFEQSALKAESYLSYSAFSRTGLIGQLEFEKFTAEQAEYAVDTVTVDWFEQAAFKAGSYLEYSSFSRDGLVDQLIFEGFTAEQAEHGVAYYFD